MPDYIEYAKTQGFGDFHIKIDPKTGLQAIIAIHSTKLGPALGGCRFIEYPNHDAAIYDALRLARGMSYKAAVVGLPLGGGKSVIIKPKTAFDRNAYFDVFGQFVQEMNGRYITALDSGTELSDMDRLGQHTKYVASLTAHGDPSFATAEGVLRGIHAAVAFKMQQNSCKDLHIAIQGLGHVGLKLAKFLHEEGAHLSVSDINPQVLQLAEQEYQANIVPLDKIHATPCDVFVPCALGGIINDQTIPAFKTNIIAGAANNQLAEAHHGQALFDRGILYAPDYVINAGGLIYAAHQYFQDPPNAYRAQLEHIYDSLMTIFNPLIATSKPTSHIADALAEEKLA